MRVKQTVSGAALLAASRLISRALDFLALVVLARFLTPADFGVVAVAMTLITVVEAVLELPVALVLIRIPVIEPPHLDTAFTLAAIRAVILGLIVALLAWPFSLFYGDFRLFKLICLLSVAPAARGLVSPGMARFAKQSNFKPDFIIEVCGKAAALASTAAVAVSTSSYWALVAGTVAGPAMMALLSYVLAPYRPRLSLAKWRVFAGILGWGSASQAVSAINWQCDRLILARLISHSELGQFSMANDLAAIPLQMLVAPTLRSALPAFVSLGENFGRLRAAYEKTVSGIAILTMPLVIGISLLAEPGIRLVLGEKWSAAVPLLQWVIFAVIPASLVAPLGPLALAMNKTHIFVRLSVIELVVKVPLVWIGAMSFGTVGVVGVRLATTAMIALISMVVTRRLIGLSIMRQAFGPWRTFVSAGAMALVVLLTRPWLSELGSERLALALAQIAILGAATYAFALIGLWQASGRPHGAEAFAVEILRHTARRLQLVYR